MCTFQTVTADNTPWLFLLFTDYVAVLQHFGRRSKIFAGGVVRTAARNLLSLKINFRINTPIQPRQTVCRGCFYVETGGADF